MPVTTLIFSLLAALAAGSLAVAQDVDSAYTRIADCAPRTAPEGYESLISFMACEGRDGWTVHVGATAHTSRLAFGERALERQLAETPILSVAQVSNTSQTIEWRLETHRRGWRPFAAIVRWRALRPDLRGDGSRPDMVTVEEYLVVTALDARNGACHAAYVDARRVRDANTVARRAADVMARRFECGSRAPFRIGPAEAERLMRSGPRPP